MSRQIASASAGLSAPSRGLRGATTRPAKIAALAAVWLTGSNSSSAWTSGANGSERKPPCGGRIRASFSSPVSGSVRPVCRQENRLIGP